jgi:predicted dehydrogenase
MIQIGIVGLGYLGRIHLEILHELSATFQIVGVHDRHLDKALEIQSLYPNLKVFEHYNDLLDAVDAVGIIASTPAHYELALTALQKNKAVFIEKPMCATLHEAQVLTEFASQNELLIQVGHVERFNPAFCVGAQKLKNVRMRHFKAQRTGAFQQRGSEVSVVLDLMIHDIDLLLSLNPGIITHLSVNAKCEQSKFADEVTAQLVFSDGFEAALFTSRISDQRSRMIAIETEQERFQFDLLARTTAILDFKTENMIELDVPQVNALRFQWEEFAKSFYGHSLPQVGAEAGLRALALAYEIDKLALAQIQ